MPPPAKAGAARTLDVGCGRDKIPGALGVDRVALPGVDVVHDLDSYPWPFEDSSFEALVREQIMLGFPYAHPTPMPANPAPMTKTDTRSGSRRREQSEAATAKPYATIERESIKLDSTHRLRQ